MSDEVKPALTPEEWAEVTEDAKYFADAITESADNLATAFFEIKEQGTRHALAALALHGQPFGFTREDVRNLQESQLWADSTQLTVGGKAVDFPMGVPCVDLNIERRTPTPRLRYYVATALLAIARVCRHLAYRIAL